MKTINLLTLLCAIFCAQAYAGTVICLKEAAVVAGGYIRLGEIAEVRGDDCMSLSRIFVGPAPEDEASWSVSRRDILQRLRGLGLDNEITFEGGEAVKVTAGKADAALPTVQESVQLAAQNSGLTEFVDRLEAKSEPVPAVKTTAVKAEEADPLADLPDADSAALKSEKSEAIQAPDAAQTANIAAVAGKPIAWRAGGKAANAVNADGINPDAVRILIDQAAKRYVAQTLNTPDAEIATVVTRFQVSTLPASVEIEAVRNGELPGRAEASLLLKDADDKLIGYGSAEIAANAMVVVPLLLRNLKMNEEVMRGDIEMRKIRFKSGMPAAGAKPDEFLGQTAARQLRSGSIVCPGDFSAGLDVRKGQGVQVNTIVDGIRVGEMAMALSDGRRGDFINVESVVTKTTYKARVTGPGTADLPIAAGGNGMNGGGNNRVANRQDNRQAR